MLGVKNFPVLIGVGTDRAAVNVAGTDGLKGQLIGSLPWLYWSWCCPLHNCLCIFFCLCLCITSNRILM